MREREISRSKRLYYVMVAIITVFIMGIVINISSVIAHAESAGKITANTCNIRSEASTTSNAIGSKSNGDAITILGQKTGSDGYIWYQIYVDATTVGYVRSDLAEVTDGSVPDTINADGTITSIDSTVTEVNPVAGTVTGGQAVRVRADASTSSTIVETASSGASLTVIGTKDDSDGRTWYYVQLTNDGTTSKGFIRADFIELSGELTPVSSADTGSDTTTTEPDTSNTDNTTTTTKDYDTELVDGEWYLYDYAAGNKYSITSMFEIINSSADNQTKKGGSTATVVWLIIFIIIAILAIAAAAYLFLKLREARDASAFADAEKERKNRQANRENKNATQKNGAARPASNGTRPAGARPNGTATRPAGARPASNGTRPVAGANGSASRPAGARPAGTANRPAGTASRPAGARPAGSVQRPVAGAASTGARPAGSVQRPIAGAQSRSVQTSDNVPKADSKPQTKVSSQEDEDFEFGFLNWDGDDKN